MGLFLPSSRDTEHYFGSLWCRTCLHIKRSQPVTNTQVLFTDPLKPFPQDIWALFLPDITFHFFIYLQNTPSRGRKSVTSLYFTWTVLNFQRRTRGKKNKSIFTANITNKTTGWCFLSLANLQCKFWTEFFRTGHIQLTHETQGCALIYNILSLAMWAGIKLMSQKQEDW